MLRVIRTTVVGVGLAAVAFLVYRDFRANQYDAAQAEIAALKQEMAARLAERDAMIQRLSRTHRVAHLLVDGQRFDAVGTAIETDLTLIELGEDGAEVDRQSFTIPGDVLFVDALTVRFDAEAVAAGDPLRGRTLVLLRRIYSERMRPADGFPIDTPGAVPPAYAVDEMGIFERRLWDQFWAIATDAALAEHLGVRVAQGEAVYKPVAAGEVFELQADAIGGLSLVPLARTARVPAP